MAPFLTFSVVITSLCSSVLWVEADKRELQTLKRQKREWIIPPKKLFENVDYTTEEYIAKIRSDEETRENIIYSLIGPAVDSGLFTVGSKTGLVKIHGILDREKVSAYELKGRASMTNGELAEKDLDLKIMVLDQNDNPPEFKVQVSASVDELSERGTHVIVITALDADEPGTPHTEIVYDIIQQEPAGEMMFTVVRVSGEIKVSINTLDRETHETYRLIITGTDMKGDKSDATNRPLTGTGTMIITINDVNDNIPILEKSSYVGSVEENIRNVEAIRIKSIDLDKIYTENWEAVYTIISGNEAGYFSITTDKETNEGILMVTKELNYEELKEVNLEVVVRNKAEYHKSVVVEKQQKYPITINVVNVPEAPHFQPAVKVIYISENRETIDLTKVITIYKATDSDTLLTATNVRYVKGIDSGNWVNINEQTAEIRLNKYPDRESKYLINGTYYITILAITDGLTAKTATGTVAIQVEDYNDHCPILNSEVTIMCYGSSVVYVSATDADNFPNAEPFEFFLAKENTKEKWSIEHLNATSSILRSQEILWPGYYSVELEVKDQQGKSCEVQKLKVFVCKCTKEQVCIPFKQTDRDHRLGVFGVLVLLLGVLLLLLIPLMLLICDCGGGVGGFQDFPYDQKQNLMIYHTEGQGEDKHDLTMLSQVPVYVDGGGGRSDLGFGWESHEYWRKYGFRSEEEYLKQKWYLEHGHHVDHKKTGMVEQTDFYTESSFSSTALSAAFFSKYYTTKTLELINQEAAVDHLLVSGYEDCISVASSFEDISSHLHEETNLDFLDDLGLHFRRLAEICSGSAIQLKFSSTPTPTKTISSSSQVGVNVKGAVDVSQKEATSVSASSSSSTTKIATETTNYSENISSGSATSATTIGQTQFIHRPTVILTPTPVYVVEQQRQPALLLASGPILGVQKSNVVLVEKGATNIAVVSQNTLPRQGLQQANTRVLVDSGVGSTLQHGFSGSSEQQGTASGTFRIVERRVESTEPVNVMQSSSRSSISKSQSMQVKGQMEESLDLGNASGFPAALSVSQRDVVNGSTHQEVREERVSVVKESFQSSSMSTS